MKIYLKLNNYYNECLMTFPPTDLNGVSLRQEIRYEINIFKSGCQNLGSFHSYTSAFKNIFTILKVHSKFPNWNFCFFFAVFYYAL